MSTKAPTAKDGSPKAGPTSKVDGAAAGAAASSAADSEEEKEDDRPVIDMDTFNQLQEMDDDEEERDFSRGIIWTYFDQVPEKFDVIRDNLVTGNYLEVSQVAHFLKGSSAALGVIRVTELFEKIQVTAKDIWKAEKASRQAAAAAAKPAFDESSSTLTTEQSEVVQAAKEAALEAEAKNVRQVKRWFEKVKGEYETAEAWLRGEYDGAESD